VAKKSFVTFTPSGAIPVKCNDSDAMRYYKGDWNSLERQSAIAPPSFGNEQAEIVTQKVLEILQMKPEDAVARAGLVH
jgi:hypothetical protein